MDNGACASSRAEICPPHLSHDEMRDPDLLPRRMKYHPYPALRLLADRPRGNSNLNAEGTWGEFANDGTGRLILELEKVP